MSDEEDVHSGSEEEEESEEEAQPEAPAQMPPPKAGPSEAELAMKRRREAQVASGNLDEAAQELLEANMEERVKLEAEIEEMRKKSEQRKKERLQEEKRMSEKRAEEDARRKAEEEERKKKKEEEEAKRKEERASKMAEFEKFKNPQKRNFVISSSRKETSDTSDDEDGAGEEKKSREQLEAEKKAILAQRIMPLDIAGCDSSKLMDKAKELHTLIMRLEGEKYDLEKQFKEQQIDMLELAERARSINKVGKGGLKRLTLTDGSDKIQERFSGAPAKIVMFSQFERQKDNRTYVDRRDIFLGPTYVLPPNRIVPTKILKWSDDGLPIYEEMEGGEEAQEEAQEE